MIETLIDDYSSKHIKDNKSNEKIIRNKYFYQNFIL